MKRTVIGGSTCPPAMMDAFEDKYGVQVIHAWGMTELSPMGALGKLKGKHVNLDAAQRRALQAKQGRVAVRHRHEDRGRERRANCPATAGPRAS